MPGRRLPRLALSVTLAAVCLDSRVALGREQLRVQASAQLVHLGFVRAGGAAEVSGGLTDEVSEPIRSGEIVLTAPEAVAAHARPCHVGDQVHAAGASVVTTTDGAGLFCIRLETDATLEGAPLSYAGDRYHASTHAAVPHETAKRRLTLAFDSPSLAVSLDSPSMIVTVTAHSVDDARNGEPIRLVLSEAAAPNGGKETELAATDVPIGGTARFDVETRLLGAPGTGRLVARFAGSGSLSPCEESALLERHAAAHLALAAPIAPSDPEEGVEILVGVGSRAGAVTEGWVEAMLGNQPAGLAPVVAGASRVVTTFTRLRGRPAVVTLRYVPSGGGAGYVAGEPLTLTVPLRPASPWGAAPWLAVGCGITYLVVRSWRRPARTSRERVADKESTGHGRALVELVERDASHSGWRGRVIDAHDGTAVAGARVSIVVPAFDGEGIAASHVAGADGAFTLVHVVAARNEGARLVVTAPFHATLSGAVPPDGVLTICVLSRRRALLDRLVGWATRAGRPWARTKEATPLEIAEVARNRHQPDIAQWATAVAEAAYGPKAPDERREQEIAAREPLLAPERLISSGDGPERVERPGDEHRREHQRGREDGGDER